MDAGSVISVAVPVTGLRLPGGRVVIDVSLGPSVVSSGGLYLYVAL